MSDFPENPYAAGAPGPPRPTESDPSAGPPPAVVRWQIVYLVFMTLLYLLVAIVGLFLWLNADAIGADDVERDSAEFRVMGIIYVVMGVVLAILFAGGIVLRRGMIGWVYNLILIIIGLTSCCLWPATIPLIIYWIKAKDQIVGG